MFTACATDLLNSSVNIALSSLTRSVDDFLCIFLQANLNLDVSGLLTKLKDAGQRKTYQWIRIRISRMWSRWANAAKNLHQKEDLTGRKQIKVRSLSMSMAYFYR